MSKTAETEHAIDAALASAPRLAHEHGLSVAVVRLIILDGLCAFTHDFTTQAIASLRAVAGAKEEVRHD